MFNSICLIKFMLHICNLYIINKQTKIMKKILLLTATVGMVLGATAQNARKLSKNDPIVYAPKKNFGAYEAQFIYSGPKKNTNNFVAAVGQVKMGDQANAYGTGFTPYKQLVTVPELNTVAFGHRGLGSALGGSGSIRLDFSNDKGLTFSSNNGPIYQSSGSLDSSNARYPNIGVYNPAGNTNPANLKGLGYGPTLDGTGSAGWGGIFNSVFNVSSTPVIAQDASNSNPLSSKYHNARITVPEHFAISRQGVAIGVAADLNSADEYNDSLLVSRTVYTGAASLPIYTHTKIPFTAVDGRFTSAKVAFSPDGQIAYIAMLTNTSIADADSFYHLALLKSTDAGATWGAPISLFVDPVTPGAKQIAGVIADLPTAGPGQTIGYGFSFHLSLGVDAFGNPYIGTDISTVLIADSAGGTPTGAWSFGSGFQNNAHFCVYSLDGGNTFISKLIAYPLTFRGTFGSALDVSEDRRPAIATSVDGKYITCVYFDTDTNVAATNLNPNAFAMTFNCFDANGGTWGNLEDSLTAGTVNEASMIQGTVGDYLFDGSAPGKFYLPMSFTALNGGSTTIANELYYTTEVEFTAPSNPLVGIKAIDKTANISVSPNPTNGILNVNFTAVNNTTSTIEVFNVLGSQVANLSHTSTEGNNSVKIDLTSFVNGVYMVRLTSEGVTTTTRVVKN